MQYDIRARRKALGLTMLDVAKAVGVAEGTVSRWENGEIQNIKSNRIEKLAAVLQVSTEELMNWEPPVVRVTKKDLLMEKIFFMSDDQCDALLRLIDSLS